MENLIHIQLAPTAFALAFGTIIFFAIKIWQWGRIYNIENYYKIYAGHILKLYEKEVIDEKTSFKYIQNLIPICNLKFKFKYTVYDFYYDKEIAKQALETIKQLYQGEKNV